ncbi:hypothetical protein [Wielerella bovis]|uniref:hypothetical protein n=1 Tax=Wielerella bovis TaxID=2917790 RepID=UPI002019096E|nr:hypothetical protein [Wielerella bovis]ULJ62347.1 hypothetical protein MIS46_10380 [Wielerella bovis]ULJ64572.1 hypothetical protein MIS33_10650 [Wielerella bovis]ULJ66861.1 hypothetical protein MIS31_11625 [Wielerella bovis]
MKIKILPILLISLLAACQNTEPNNDAALLSQLKVEHINRLTHNIHLRNMAIENKAYTLLPLLDAEISQNFLLLQAHEVAFSQVEYPELGEYAVDLKQQRQKLACAIQKSYAKHEMVWVNSTVHSDEQNAEVKQNHLQQIQKYCEQNHSGSLKNQAA